MSANVLHIPKQKHYTWNVDRVASIGMRITCIDAIGHTPRFRVWNPILPVYDHLLGDVWYAYTYVITVSLVQNVGNPVDKMAVFWNEALCSLLNTMEALNSSETSVSVYYTIQRYIPEARHLIYPIENLHSLSLALY
jgi:hypothetical protein